ncbi:methyl-accepting chemotaxis protein [Amorphoplanes digitatis]|uniref:Methyl-accepting chemotaxis protein n=1 Tax=Actinoplanes digitatis TaxID=1868 RepID=A0A7W7I4R6_9ACTN|nr:methyl-accepting chemotaxis protein [Actinoplanes digitatis]MBB4766203.1 methyl-accepting chemotaxis protein [Actinoplanes digitatis]GID96024.1 chemotaxis protein [Actinoplanes digitatis]
MPKFKLPRRSRKALHSAEASARGGLLRNLRVSQKLFVSFGVLSLLVVTIGVADGVALSTTNGQLNKMYNDNLQSVARIGQVRADVQQANLLSTKLILRSPLADVSSVQTAIRRLDAAIDANWAAYSKNPAKGTEADMAAFSEGLTKYRTIRDERLVPAAKANSLGTYLGVQNNYIDPLTSTITVALNNLAGIEDKAAQRQMADARSNATSARLLTMTLMGVALAFAVVIALVVSRAIARPLGQTVKILEALAEGRLDQRLAVRGRDEVGRMAEALNTALDRLTATLRDIAGNVTTLASSSEELTAVAGQMNSSAARSADRAQAVSTASGQISSNIATVSAGAEEIGSSITEIALSTSSAADVAGQAVRISTDAGAILQKLGESSAEIVSVIKIITGIAEQTNLLALNATIEAARAGDAGKGFAVVAGEVKELAQETARATEDIRTRVGAIQNDSSAAVAAIAEIGSVIDKINATQSAIAAAVEEQTATTNEMSRNVGEVAIGSQQISSNVAEVAEAAAETTNAASNTAQAADELARVAHELQQSLAMFRY